MSAAHTRASYVNGLRHGRSLAAYGQLVNHEPALRLELQLSGSSGRAYALGALRGYRQATNRPC